MSHELKILPFFPLSVFLLPGEDIPLRIFEPRYKQLIEEARMEGFTFAIPFVIDSEIQDFGCEVKLKDVVAENPAGRMVVTVESVAVIKVVGFTRQLKGKLYAGGTISYIEPPQLIEDSNLMNLIIDYTDHFDQEFLSCCSDSVISHYDLLKALNLSSEDKYSYIRLDSVEQQENYLTTQIRFLMMIRNQEQLLGNDFGLN